MVELLVKEKSPKKFAFNFYQLILHPPTIPNFFCVVVTQPFIFGKFWLQPALDKPSLPFILSFSFSLSLTPFPFFLHLDWSYPDKGRFSIPIFLPSILFCFQFYGIWITFWMKQEKIEGFHSHLGLFSFKSVSGSFSFRSFDSYLSWVLPIEDSCWRISKWGEKFVKKLYFWVFSFVFYLLFSIIISAFP